MVEKKLIGKITHFYPKISVAVIELEDTLNVGDTIFIERGEETFEQKVESMQIEHENIEQAESGQSVGLKVEGQTKEGAKVFKVIE
ncbi:translation elongation factor-like protein [Candidatus Micrarchaeota archaeon RBG_16_36_9]|nr:MAG: translation elongation factor-like protein [Candidatus Micrarchaeota archaeon RBG_16_36_9]